jgi:hypothetical protein
VQGGLMLSRDKRDLDRHHPAVLALIISFLRMSFLLPGPSARTGQRYKPSTSEVRKKPLREVCGET